MELENVLKLINAVSESSLTSFSMEDGDTRLSFGADRSPSGTCNSAITTDIYKENAGRTNSDGLCTDVQKFTRTEEDNAVTINSPLVGVFYSAASCDEDNYVSVGDKVKKGQVIGIVEAMKLMNEIESDYDGVITDILVDNEQMVEYGQPMFVISKE